jgi:hypothetical protein
MAVRADEAVGFLAWERPYDLHHCLTGGHILGGRGFRKVFWWAQNAGTTKAL